jgi:hypothetical protein
MRRARTGALTPDTVTLTKKVVKGTLFRVVGYFDRVFFARARFWPLEIALQM